MRKESSGKFGREELIFWLRVESRRLQRLGDLEDIQARCEKVDVEEADITTISLFSGGAYKVSIPTWLRLMCIFLTI